MVDIEITTHGDFQIATARGKSGFTAWGKMGKIQATDPIKEPGGHVWCNFGETRDAARAALLIELGLAPSNALTSAAAVGGRLRRIVSKIPNREVQPHNRKWLILER